jgi:hypothetical protein
VRTSREKDKVLVALTHAIGLAELAGDGETVDSLLSVVQARAEKLDREARR